MSLIIIFLIAFSFIVIVALIWMSFLPSKIVVEEQIVINKSVSEIWDEIHDFKNWNSWSPWICHDHDCKTYYLGAPSGVGAIYSWKGELIGEGEIEHVEVDDLHRIQQELRFMKPFKSISKVFWTLKTLDFDKTRVKWSMHGKIPFIMRFMTKQMRAFLAMDYKRGLKLLKEKAEKGKVSMNIQKYEVVSSNKIEYIGLRSKCKFIDLGEKMKETLISVKEILKSSDMITDYGISVYHEYDVFTHNCEFTAGFSPKVHKPVREADCVRGVIPKVRVIKVTFKGDYSNLRNAWTCGFNFMQKKGYKQLKSLPPFEIYRNRPQHVSSPDDLLTEIYIPIKGTVRK